MVEKFTGMIISITKFFGVPATTIEIHPGDKRNTFEEIIKSIVFLLRRYNEEFNVEPQILIENRTGQLISSGKKIQCFWKFLSEKYPQLKRKSGIVLDVQQLYTVTRKNFLKEFEMIPSESLKGFHIHYKHMVPDPSNEIPWKQVFRRVAGIRESIIVNPEVFHKNKVKIAIDFCRNMLQSGL